MRIFTVSDIHIDYAKNLEWLRQLPVHEYNDDVLILAGDLSDKLDRIEVAFKHLAQGFGKVAFVPGNHDLWVRKNDGINSLQKFQLVSEMAEAYGIKTSVIETDSYRIVPVLGWYDFSFGPCTEYLEERWMDFYACDWGEELESLPAFSEREEAISRHFMNMNEKPETLTGNKPVMTFSHFMPRIDIMPDYIPEIHQRLYPILGSWKIDEYIRQLGSQLHIYGHSHLNRDEEIKGVRYINNAYGNPGEERIAMKALRRVA